MASEAPGGTGDSTLDRLKDLQKRAANLVTEFHAFSDFLRSKAKQDEVEMRMFRRGLEAEVEGLEMAISGTHRIRYGLDQLPHDEAAVKRERLLQTSNVPHYEIWWSLAKQCKGVRGLGRRVVLDSRDGRRRTGKRSNPTQGQEVQVDIMADDGQEWIKISTMSEKRLIFEMAKEGWERYGDFSDSDSESNDTPSHPFEKPKLELVRLASSLRAASLTIRARYKHPRVRFILPRLTEGQTPSIDALLADIRATGALVECGLSSNPSLHHPPTSPTPSLTDTFTHMLPTTPNPQLTPTLNIDCSILIALISDQCHTPPSLLPHKPPLLPNRTYHAALLAQMADEEAAPLLPNTLYPLLQGRELVCTGEAAGRMRNIVGMMGTEGERRRGEVLLGRATYDGWDGGVLRTELAGLSRYEVPGGLRLPVRVVAVAVPRAEEVVGLFPGWKDGEVFGRLLLSTKLSTLNAAVLLFGWKEGVVTVTSNQTAVNQVERGLGGVLDGMERERLGGGGEGDFEPPKFWVVQGCRSLVGKEKRPKVDEVNEKKANGTLQQQSQED